MADEKLTQLLQQALTALKAGSEVAAKSTDEIQNDVRYPQLRTMLEEGNQHSRQWATRIDNALQEAGGETDERQNPVLEALYEVSRRIRANAPDEYTRDLGIIANGQLALHYWIAAFGTIRTYAEKADLQQTVQEMQASLQEAKQADERLTQIAQEIMSGAMAGVS